MEWLIVAGIVSLLSGVLLVFSSETLKKLGDLLNTPLGQIDGVLLAARIPAGIALVIVGGWIISVAFAYPELWYLHLVGGLLLAFGLLYLFLAQWLTVLSQLCDQLLLSTDDLVLGTRKSFGVVLIVIALYIFYAAYLSAR
ncbi:MAG: hypothetical protein MUC35_00425 [Candidatus Margulisbacteria bacterium]|jgi:hypothetical protein|nr:hypothetical protein [Candidatus Margulisiibacteriota bacterium]